MKKSPLLYLQYRIKRGNRWHKMDAKQLYQEAVRKRWVKVRNLPWKVVKLTAQVDLSTGSGKAAKADYLTVKLLFVRGVNVEPGPDAGAKNWALFLCTDETPSSSKILEIYALRWGYRSVLQRSQTASGISAGR